MVCCVPDVADLEKKESILDKLIADCTKSLRELTEGPDNTGYPFYVHRIEKSYVIMLPWVRNSFLTYLYHKDRKIPVV